MKRVFSVLIVILLILLFPLTAYAEETDKNEEEIYQEMTEGFKEGIDSDVSQELEKYDIDVSDPQTLKELETSDIFSKIISALSANVGHAVKILVKVIALIVLCSIVKNCVPENNSVSGVFSFVSVITVLSVIMNTLQDCIDLSLNALNGMNTFMTCYIPVFTSVVVTSGNVTSGNSYYVVMFSICEIVTLIANTFILPVLSIVLSLSVVGALNSDFPFHKTAEGLKKVVQWILGGAMTVVVAVLSIRSIIGTSVDNVATRSAKYVVSTFVPVVGGAVSEAFLTVKGSMGVIRSGIGSLGIIIILFIIITPVASIVVIRLSIKVCEMIAEMFDEKPICVLMSSVSSMLSICLSTVICVSVMFILSTALLLMIK
ncbi:MAG: hypothetical protein E7509_04615 [Ruminococcus sp.]|nr:hypothetical protein [Ruminococcus sp.]